MGAAMLALVPHRPNRAGLLWNGGPTVKHVFEKAHVLYWRAKRGGLAGSNRGRTKGD